MKKYQSIFIIVIISLLMIRCDKHDSIDDNVIVGKMAPQVYWEIGSSTVSAGIGVSFAAQYYTTGDAEINRLEVWYNVLEEESKSVTCPWTTTFSYSYTANYIVEKRVSQKITEYQHNPVCWNDSLSAYYLLDVFPTSPTLSSISWVNPESFTDEEETRMNTYFGADFMQNFKDSLYNLLKPADFEKMYQGLNLVEDFRDTYLVEWDNPNTGLLEYIFPNNVVHEDVKNIYETIPFADLIFNSTNNNYSVEFTRLYKLEPVLKAFDNDNVTGITTTITIIDLN